MDLKSIVVLLVVIGELSDFLVFGVGDLFLYDGAGVAIGCGLLDDGAAHFLKVGIFALVAGISFALTGVGVFVVLVGIGALMLLASAERLIDASADALHV